MNADEARAITREAVAGPAIEPELSKLHAKIKNAASEGKTVVTYLPTCKDHIKKAVLKRIEEDGFTVKYVDNYDPRDPRESSYYTISW